MTPTHMAAGLAVSIVAIGGIYYLFTQDEEPKPKQSPLEKSTDIKSPITQTEQSLTAQATITKNDNPILVQDQTKPNEEPEEVQQEAQEYL